jgi:hypothetical protein
MGRSGIKLDYPLLFLRCVCGSVDVFFEVNAERFRTETASVFRRVDAFRIRRRLKREARGHCERESARGKEDESQRATETSAETHRCIIPSTNFDGACSDRVRFLCQPVDSRPLACCRSAPGPALLSRRAAPICKSNGEMWLMCQLSRPLSTPNNERAMAATKHLTSLMACLDPKNRFPILNGEAGVNQRPAKLGLKHVGLEEQVRGFIGLIGQFGLTDAFAVDAMTEAQMQKITKRVKHRSDPQPFAANQPGAPRALSWGTCHMVRRTVPLEDCFGVQPTQRLIGFRNNLYDALWQGATMGATVEIYCNSSFIIIYLWLVFGNRRHHS